MNARLKAFFLVSFGLLFIIVGVGLFIGLQEQHDEAIAHQDLTSVKTHIITTEYEYDQENVLEEKKKEEEQLIVSKEKEQVESDLQEGLEWFIETYSMWMGEENTLDFFKAIPAIKLVGSHEENNGTYSRQTHLIRINYEGPDPVGTMFHELGHHWEELYLNNEDWKDYLVWRSIDDEEKWDSKEWQYRPEEVFAEDFRNLFETERGIPDETVPIFIRNRTDKDILSESQQTELKKMMRTLLP